MTSAITAASIEQFWKKYKLEGKIQFLTLSAGDDRRTRIAVKYLCCDSEVKNVSWNNFRKKIMSGIVVCQRCAIRKSAEDWRTDFFEAIASKPGLFVRWDVVQDGEEIFFRSVCGTCGAAGERRASNQALRAIRAGKSLCRQCATSERGESQLLTVSEMREALAKLPGHQWVRIDAITRKKNQWQVSGVCLRNDCGAPILSSFANMKKSLAAGHTGCGKCAREIQAESQRITASGVLDYAAGRDLQHRLQNVQVTNVRGRSWIEADCDLPPSSRTNLK